MIFSLCIISYFTNCFILCTCPAGFELKHSGSEFLEYLEINIKLRQFFKDFCEKKNLLVFFFQVTLISGLVSFLFVRMKLGLAGTMLRPVLFSFVEICFPYVKKFFFLGFINLLSTLFILTPFIFRSWFGKIFVIFIVCS